VALATACKVAAYDLPSGKDAHFSAVVKRFLRRGVVGAELRLTVSVCRLDKTRVEFAFGGDPAGDRGTMTKNLVDACSVTLPRGLNPDELKERAAACLAAGWETKLTYLCSFRSWIQGL